MGPLLPPRLMNFVGWLAEKFASVELFYNIGDVKGGHPTVDRAWLRVEPVNLEFWSKISGDTLPQQIACFELDQETGVACFELHLLYIRDIGLTSFSREIERLYAVNTRNVHLLKNSLNQISITLTSAEE